MAGNSPKGNSGGRRVTMRDIARQADVSQATVSLVLNKNQDVRISDDTRMRVLEVAKRLGYRLPRGKQLENAPRGKSPFIGFMADDLAGSIFASISVEGARSAAWNAGYVLNVVVTGGDAELENNLMRQWIDEGVKGVIYSTVVTREISPPKSFAAVPCVLLNCHSDEGRITTVLPGDKHGGYAATEALLQAGRRRIGFIGGEDWMDASNERLVGYRMALSSANIRVDRTLIQPGAFTLERGLLGMRALLALNEPPDGVFCGNDLSAVGAYLAIREAGLRIPEDIAVVGFDDHDVARQLDPPLTTVLLPHREMGDWAVSHLLTDSGSSAPRTYFLECPLVPRDSCPSTIPSAETTLDNRAAV